MVTSRSTAVLRGQILDTLGFTLTGISDSTWGTLDVHRGVPWVILNDLQCHYRYTGDDGPAWDISTLDSVGVWHNILISVFWKPPESGSLRENLEGTVWGVANSITQAIRGADTLQGLVDRIDPQPAKADIWQHFSGAVYYALEIELKVMLFDSDAWGV
jgi:hypothetical protein